MPCFPFPPEETGRGINPFTLHLERLGFLPLPCTCEKPWCRFCLLPLEGVWRANRQERAGPLRLASCTHSQSSSEWKTGFPSHGPCRGAATQHLHGATCRDRGTPTAITWRWALISWGWRKDSWQAIPKKRCSHPKNYRRMAPLMGMSCELTKMPQVNQF